jgi:AAA+ ATPase superfamily predicted ATPase
MAEFWGRDSEVAALRRDLEEVRRSGRGRMLAIRGRRQSGKSRLVTEFLEAERVPYLFTTAIKGAPPEMQLAAVMQDLEQAKTPLPAGENAFAAPAGTWEDLFARLPVAFDRREAVVVIDEFPWATETDPTLEGVLQRVWDRTFERLPVLLILIGSDMAMMEQLTAYDRPLYGRAVERVLRPLSPSGVAEALGDDRSPLELLDAYLVTGGYPRLVTEAARFRSTRRFVRTQFADDSSPLLVVGQRVVTSEFSDSAAARTVLEAIGSVEVGPATFSETVARLGGGDTTTVGTRVTRALETLQTKRLVSIETPVGSRNSKLRRYRIADPYLRFWLRFCAPELANIERGRMDLAVDRFDRGFESWRGRSIEPVVQEAVSRLAATGSGRFADLETVGSWWDRKGDHEFDIVAADRNGRVGWVGSIKWRAGRRMSRSDADALARARAVVPRAEAAQLLAVCPAGADPHAGFDDVLDASDILDAYR